VSRIRARSRAGFFLFPGFSEENERNQKVVRTMSKDYWNAARWLTVNNHNVTIRQLVCFDIHQAIIAVVKRKPIPEINNVGLPLSLEKTPIGANPFAVLADYSPSSGSPQ
jgi:hypothetical protein